MTRLEDSKQHLLLLRNRRLSGINRLLLHLVQQVPVTRLHLELLWYLVVLLQVRLVGGWPVVRLGGILRHNNLHRSAVVPLVPPVALLSPLHSEFQTHSKRLLVGSRRLVVATFLEGVVQTKENQKLLVSSLLKANAGMVTIAGSRTSPSRGEEIVEDTANRAIASVTAHLVALADEVLVKFRGYSLWTRVS